jgi:hypothetical protein
MKRMRKCNDEVYQLAKVIYRHTCTYKEKNCVIFTGESSTETQTKCTVAVSVKQI